MTKSIIQNFPKNEQYNVVKTPVLVIDIPAPVRFQERRFGTLRLDEIADIATGLFMLTGDPGERRGIIAMARALGVELVS